MKKHKIPKIDKKAQAQILIGILVIFASLAIISVLMAPMLAFIDIGINATNGTANGDIIAALLNLAPVFIVLMFIIIIFMLARG